MGTTFWLDDFATVYDFPSPGITFYDFTPILFDPSKRKRLTVELYEEARQLGTPDIIAAIDARGFILGTMLAELWDVGLVLLRKPNKLPAPLYRYDYDLEYGMDSLELNQELDGLSVTIVDDVLATGGTLAAAEQLIRQAGGNVLGSVVLLELEELQGQARLDYPLRAVAWPHRKRKEPYD